MERGSTSLTKQDTTATSVRVVLVQKLENNKCQQGCGDTGTLCTGGGTVNGVMLPQWKTVVKFRKTLKIELLYDPKVPLLGIYLIELKT